MVVKFENCIYIILRTLGTFLLECWKILVAEFNESINSDENLMIYKETNEKNNTYKKQAKQ